MSRRFPIASLLFSRKTAALGGGLLVLIFLGCMCFNIGNQVASSETFEQEGHVNVPANCEIDVYYPVPYAAPPNLTLENGQNDVFILDQKDNHFRVVNRNGSKSRSVDWKANGQHVQTAVVPEAPPPGTPVGDSGPAGAKIALPKSNN